MVKYDGRTTTGIYIVEHPDDGHESPKHAGGNNNNNKKKNIYNKFINVHFAGLRSNDRFTLMHCMEHKKANIVHWPVPSGNGPRMKGR
jgi:hypothetical protein